MSSTSLEDRIAALEPAMVERALGELCNSLGAHVRPETIRATAKSEETARSLLELDVEIPTSAPLPAALGRSLLMHASRNDVLRPLLEQAIAPPEPGEESVTGIILALGAVVNLTLLVATTRIVVETGTDGKARWRIEKKPATTELVDAVVRPVVEAGRKLIGGPGA